MHKSPGEALQRLLDESSLLSSSQPIDHLLLKNMLASHYGLAGKIERLGSEKGHTFRLKADASEYLVKVSPSDEPELVTALQIAAMRHLETVAQAIPVQRIKRTSDQKDSVPIDLSDGTSRTLSVFCFVDGVLWEEIEAEDEHLNKLGNMLGRANRALQVFEHPASMRSLVYDIGHFHHWAGLLDYTPDPKHRQLAQQVFKLFDEFVLPKLAGLEKQVIHGDYAPNNVVVDPGNDIFVKSILDFGDAVHTAVIFDPANAVAHLIGRTHKKPWQDAYAFVTGYEQSRPIKALELPLLPVAALARLTMLALIRYWKAERAPEQREELFTSANNYWTNLERAMSVPLDEVVAQFWNRATV